MAYVHTARINKMCTNIIKLYNNDILNKICDENLVFNSCTYRLFKISFARLLSRFEKYYKFNKKNNIYNTKETFDANLLTGAYLKNYCDYKQLSGITYLLNTTNSAIEHLYDYCDFNNVYYLVYSEHEKIFKTIFVNYVLNTIGQCVYTTLFLNNNTKYLATPGFITQNFIRYCKTGITKDKFDQIWSNLDYTKLDHKNLFETINEKAQIYKLLRNLYENKATLTNQISLCFLQPRYFRDVFIRNEWIWLHLIVSKHFNEIKKSNEVEDSKVVTPNIKFISDIIEI